MFFSHLSQIAAKSSLSSGDSSITSGPSPTAIGGMLTSRGGALEVGHIMMTTVVSGSSDRPVLLAEVVRLRRLTLRIQVWLHAHCS